MACRGSGVPTRRWPLPPGGADRVGPSSLSSMNSTQVGVVPVFSPAWVWAGSQWARPAQPGARHIDAVVLGDG